MPTLTGTMQNEYLKRVLPSCQAASADAAPGHAALKVQLLRMSPNTLRECRWGCTWITTTRTAPTPMGGPLSRHAQLAVDSQWLYHGGYHHGHGTRYAVITTFESGPELERWIDTQLPSAAAAAA